MNRHPAAHLSPAEVCARLGVSIKALRLYERHGLVTPMRSAAGWRLYGPQEMARLHQILALKALGLRLARIAELLHGRSLAQILEVQERALLLDHERLGNALELVRRARARLADGDALSLDDLVELAEWTVTSRRPSNAELEAIFEPLISRHFSAEDRGRLEQKPFDPARAGSQWDVLITEAKKLMLKGDHTSPEALALARRWQAQIALFSGGDLQLEAKAGIALVPWFVDHSAAGVLGLPLDPTIAASGSITAASPIHLSQFLSAPPLVPGPACLQGGLSVPAHRRLPSTCPHGPTEA